MTEATGHEAAPAGVPGSEVSAATPVALVARCCSSDGRRPTRSMKISSIDGSAIWKWFTRSPRSRAARRTDLGVDVAVDVELRVVHAGARDAHAAEVGDPGKVRTSRAVTVRAFDAEPHDPPPGRALDLGDRPGQHELAVIDERDRVAQLLDRLHLVRREDERRPSLPHPLERLLEQRDVHRIQPDERLVHDQDRGLVEDRGDQLDLLLVALRELLGPALLVFRDSEARQPLPCARGRDVARDAVQRREEHELPEHLEPGVQPALLGQVAPRLARRLVGAARRPR